MLDIVEDSVTEFKVKFSDKVLTEVVAFLNSKTGGDIYIGVDDSGAVIGRPNYPSNLKI